MKNVRSALLICVTLSSCAPVGQALQDANNTMAQLNKNMAQATAPAKQQTAQAQVAQVVDKVIQNDTANRALFTEARPTIEKILSTTACISTDEMDALKQYAVAGGNCAVLSPMRYMQYHDKTQCLEVKRIGDIKVEAKNAFAFTAVFTATDSGESGNRRFTLKQEQGEWLLLNCPFVS